MILPAARPRKKKVLTAAEEAAALEARRASGRIRSRRYYAKKRAQRDAERAVVSNQYHAICSHDCGCNAEITKPVCEMCNQGLCDG